MNLNKVQLIGRLTKAPELKALANGAYVATFGLATNNVYKNKQGEKVEEATFHNCKAWNKQAETIAQYATKGSELYVEGRIENRSWDKEDGTKGYMTEIVVTNFQLGAKPKGASSSAPAAATGGEDEINLENIPF